MKFLSRLKTVVIGTIAFIRLCGRYGLRPARFYRFDHVWLCTYPQVLSMVDTTRSPRTLIDVGANNSQFARLVKAIIPEIRVLSFEPSPVCNPIGEVYRVALSDNNSEGILYWKEADTTGGALNVASASGTECQSIVETKRFDAMGISLDSLPSPILLKVDTQGHELRVIKGFGDSIHKVDFVVAEVQGDASDEYSQPELFAYMMEQGFNEFRVLFAHNNIVGTPDYMDVLWTRK